MVHLDYRDSRPIYAQIIDGYREQIATGVLQPGDKLPSVRELAGTLAINPNTIQRAYRRLEMEGWIATVPVMVCFVCVIERTIVRQWQRWYTAVDEAAAMLVSLGVPREQLICRLQEGGNKHA